MRQPRQIGSLETIQTTTGNGLETLARYAQTDSGISTSKAVANLSMTPSNRSLELTGGYCAYLVRMWQEHPQSPWRASAQNAQTGEKRVFADLEQLVAFLYVQTQSETRPPSPPSSPPADV